ncbi:MAG: 2OG-Fe dioxygenase family protein [Acidithiobacillus sp.]
MSRLESVESFLPYPRGICPSYPPICPIYPGTVPIIPPTDRGITRFADSQIPKDVTPCSALLMDDTRVIHETTPIQPARDPAAGGRDTLMLTYRADRFLECTLKYPG